MVSNTLLCAKKIALISVLILIIISVSSIAYADPGVDVDSIVVDSASISMYVGTSQDLSPTINPSNAENQNLVYTSSNTSIVSVSGNTITATGAGNATVTVHWELDSSINAIYNITTTMGSISLGSADIYINNGTDTTLTLSQSPSDLYDSSTIVWSSSNTAVATVSDGVVTPKKSGNTSVTATSADGNYTASVDITVVGISITTNVTALNLKPSDIYTLGTSVIADPAIVGTYTYGWTSSDDTIATVVDGAITCISPGIATITVTCSQNPSITATAQIKVCGIQLNKYSANLYTSDTVTLSATVLDTGSISDTSIVWSSSDLSVASVQNGVVTAASQGNCIITAVNRETNYSTSCNINTSSYALTSSTYRVSNSSSLISNVAANTNSAQFRANLKNFSSDIVIQKSDGSAMDDDIIKSGMLAKLVVNGATKDSMTIIVNGDVNGDGRMSIADYSLLRLHILNKKRISNQSFLIAADTSFDNAISISDYTLMRLDILKLKALNDGLDVLPHITDSRVRVMVETALDQYGKPYSWGDEGPNEYDCSGLVYYCIKSSGYSLVRSTAHNYSKYSSWSTVGKSSLRAGDLMFFKSDSNPDRIGHVGMYLNDGYFIHASGSYSNVVISKFEGWYDTMFTHGKRVY